MGCADVDSIGTVVFEDGERSPLADTRDAEDPMMFVLGREHERGLSLVRVDDGKAVASFELGEWAGPPDASAWIEQGELGHLSYLAVNEEESGGVLFHVGVGGPGLLRPVELGSFEGQAKVLAVPEGHLVFQEDLGARWLFAPRAGGPWSSAACPMPSSILGVDADERGAEIEALAFGPESWLARVRVRLTDGELRCSLDPISSRSTLHESARAARVPGLGAVLVDVAGAELRISPLRGHELADGVSVPVMAGRIEDVQAFAHGESLGVLVLSAEPPMLTVIELAEGGTGSALVKSFGSHPLASPVIESRALARSMVSAGDRVLVATKQGTEGFRLRAAGAIDPVELPSGVAALRAPLVALPTYGEQKH